MFVACRRAPLYVAICAVLLATFLVLSIPQTGWSQETSEEATQVRSQRITLNLQNVTLGSVLKIMTQKSGINFLIGSDLVGKTINVYLEEKFALFRHTPWFVDRLLAGRRLLGVGPRGGQEKSA